MLHRLEIENFYSIRDPQVIDLRAAAHSDEASDRLSPVWKGSGERAPKVVALFGPNASGKSNVLKAVSFLSWFTVHSFGAAPDARLPYQRFMDDDARDQPTRLAVHFGGPGDLAHLPDADADAPQCRYSYEVSFGGPRAESPRVLSESLKYWPPDAKRQVRLFERDEFHRVVAGKGFDLAGYGQALEKILRPNASVVSTLAQLGHPIAQVLVTAATSVTSNILVEKYDLSRSVVDQHYAKNPALLELLNKDLERLGLGVRAMRVEQGVNGPTAFFDHAGLAEPLDASSESHGTRLFISIFPYLVSALQTGGVALVDELDLAIHPLVLPEILSWFYDPGRNPHDAQLWMTCQNASLLDTLTKEEVLFCEKDGRGRTSVYGLRDVQSVRRGDNFYRKYLSGVYGAVPNVG
jgi:uncharacterized protein